MAMMEWDQNIWKAFFALYQRDFTRKLEVKQGSSCTTNKVTQYTLGEAGTSLTFLATTTHAYVCTQWWLLLAGLKGHCLQSVRTKF